MVYSVARAGQKVKIDHQNLSPATRLLDWYDRHRRELPWRAKAGETIDPYRVWLSEIMLQQTTVTTVIPYYKAFIAKWPTLVDFAKASLDEVLQMWAGLGYYRRARLMHACAQTVMTEFSGEFPADENLLRKLPGLGPYTAAAITAIAFGQRANVVDGNVERVMARFFAHDKALRESKSTLKEMAASLLPDDRYGDYAQALMDLGATVCSPRSPDCLICPLRVDCRAYADGLTETIPVPALKTERPRRYAAAFIITNLNGDVWLRQRSDKGLLAGMTEMPFSVWHKTEKPVAVEALLPEAPFQADWLWLDGEVIHVFTHFQLNVRVATVVINSSQPMSIEGKWVEQPDLAGQALPSLMRKILHFAGVTDQVKPKRHP